ncbi:MAG: carboxypeptidase regulatory-like domain-containing protein [Planctomycetota bacterium]
MRPFLPTLAAAAAVAIAVAWCWLVHDAGVAPPANAPTAAADARTPADLDAAATTNGVEHDPVPAVPPAGLPVPRVEAPGVEAPGAWRVFVVDPSGTPVAGAQVEFGAGRADQTATTDRDGVAAFPSRPRAITNLRVSAGSRHLAAHRGPEAPTVTLPWFGPLHGRLVDRATAAPIAGARVVREHRRCGLCNGDRTVTDADGRFVLPAVPRDEGCAFEFAAPGYPSQTVPLRLPGRGEPVAHTFAIARGVVIEGRCVDAGSRRGVAEAKVRVGWRDKATSTASDGSFRLLHLAEGSEPASLEVTASGYLRTTYEIPLSPPPGALEFALLRATGLAGRVISSSGEPVSGARVRAEARDQAGPTVGGATHVAEEREASRATTDEHGSFVIQGLVPGRAYELAAKAAVFRTRPEQEAVRARAGDRTTAIVLVLTPTSAIPTGTIVGTFRCNGVAGPGQVTWRVGRETSAVSAKANGSFRCKNVPAGPVELVATYEAAGSDLIDGVATAWRRQVVLHADEELRVDVDLQLDLVAITGRVRNADGSPPGTYMVDVVGTDLRRSVWTAPDGRFQVDVPRLAGAIVLHVPFSTRVKTQPGARDVELVLPAWGKIRYRVRGEDGSTGSFEQVWLPAVHFTNCSTSVHAPDPEGFFERNAAQGERLFLCSAPGHAPSLRSVQVRPQTTVDVVLGRGTSVRVRLAPGTAPLDSQSEVMFVDARLPGFQLWDSLAVDGEIARWVRLRAEGEEVPRVEPGTYRFVGEDPAIEFSPPTFVVGTEPVVVDVTWARRAK